MRWVIRPIYDGAMIAIYVLALIWFAGMMPA